ncbi:MAG: hypothetical protein E3J72_01365 [Planctomycetota bacterium]|nr:MAG: hypothetical protein E3J72_01365 [Planctomycetota bacterium]
MDAYKVFLKRYYDQILLFGMIGIIVIYLFLWLVSASPAGAYDEKLGLMVEKIDSAVINPKPIPRKNYVAELSDPFENVPQPNWTGDPKWAFYRIPYVKFNYFEIQPVIVNAEKPIIETLENDPDMLGTVRIKVRNVGTAETPEGGRPGHIEKLTVYRRKLGKKGEKGPEEKVFEKSKPAPDDLIEVQDDNKGKGLEENTRYEYQVRVKAAKNENPDIPERIGNDTAETEWSPIRIAICFHVKRFIVWQKDSVYVSFRVWHPEHKRFIEWRSGQYKIGDRIKQLAEISIRIDGKLVKITGMDTGYELVEILPSRVERGRGKPDRAIRCVKVKKDVKDDVIREAVFWETDLKGLEEGSSGSSGPEPPEKSTPEEEKKEEAEKKEESSSEEKKPEEKKEEEKKPRKW